MAIQWMLITSNPSTAQLADKSGVQRILIDLEILGKADRQGHLDTHKAAHSIEDISKVRRVLEDTELMVRVNPLHEGTIREVDAAISRGADRIMLPMFYSREDVIAFLDIVRSRVPVTFLVETPQALTRLSTYLNDLEPDDQIHIGLNDLSIALGLSFLFEPVAGRLLDIPARLFQETNTEWGFGGIARIGGGALPAELVLAEHIRLGSQWVILSRAFHDGLADSDNLGSQFSIADELEHLRHHEQRLREGDPAIILREHRKFVEKTFSLATARMNHSKSINTPSESI